MAGKRTNNLLPILLRIPYSKFKPHNERKSNNDEGFIIILIWNFKLKNHEETETGWWRGDKRETVLVWSDLSLKNNLFMVT